MPSSFLQNIRLIRTKSIGDRGLSNQAPTNSEIDSKLAALAPLKKLFPLSAKLLTIALVSFALNAYGEGSDDKGSDKREIKFKAIAAGDLRSLALSKDGKVYAAGFNNKGQLGLGDTTDRKVFTEVTSLSDKNIIALSVGAHHSLALSKDGKIYATGDNKYGQLGLGDNDNRDTFTEVANLSDKNIIALSVGARHSLALSKDGKVYVAGSNRFGQLGLGDSDHETNRHTFTEVTSLSAKTIVAISVGGFHSLALSKSGRVYAAGNNEAGQLGLGDSGDRVNRDTFTEVANLSDKNIIAASAAGAHSLALSKDGRVYATGWNVCGQLGLGDKTDRKIFTEVSALSGKNIIAAFAAGAHSLALSKGGAIYATGLNNKGQLGLGDSGPETDRDTFSEVTDVSAISAISAGDAHSLTLSKDGKIYATGRNKYGQLGLGDTTDRDTFTEVSVFGD